MREPEYCTNHGQGAYYCGECVDEEKRRADRAEAELALAVRELGFGDDIDAWRKHMTLTPCDRPYSDCGVCGGTGDHEGDPCAMCVWRRWGDDNRDSLKTSEELLAERADDQCSDTPKAEGKT